MLVCLQLRAIMSNSPPHVEEIRQKAEQANKVPVYIALFGQPGAGKSSLINAITGQPLAKVGVENDVTTERTDYSWNGLFLSDLPGYGTAKFPVSEYFERFEVLQFDIFLCVFAGKLKDDDIKFFGDLAEAGKQCIFVHNKFDAVFEEGVSEQELKERITASVIKQIGRDTEVVFTSCRTRSGLDELQTAITISLSGVKKDRFLRSAAAYSKDFLDKKKGACRSHALWAAGAAAVGNLVPLPGVGFAADVAAITAAMAMIRNDFGLTEARLDKFVDFMPGVAPLVNAVVGVASREGAILLLKRVAGAVAVSEMSKYIPLVGAAIAGTVSFAAITAVLFKYVDNCYEIADEMLRAQFRG